MSAQRARLAIALLVLGSLVFPTAVAAITASLQPNRIDELGTVRLTLQVSGQVSVQPDLTPLEQDFELLGTHTANQYTVSSAGSQSTTEYT
ncbi:MAG: hypothetical protein ACO3P1_03585, partial [Pseudomonadales bacterium]